MMSKFQVFQLLQSTLYPLFQRKPVRWMDTILRSDLLKNSWGAFIIWIVGKPIALLHKCNSLGHCLAYSCEPDCPWGLPINWFISQNVCASSKQRHEEAPCVPLDFFTHVTRPTKNIPWEVADPKRMGTHGESWIQPASWCLKCGVLPSTVNGRQALEE